MSESLSIETVERLLSLAGEQARRRRQGELGSVDTSEPEPDLDALVDPDADPLEKAVASFEAALLRRRVRELPVIERKVIRWRHGIESECLGWHEIGLRLGRAQGSLWAIEKRAIARLRAAYGLDADGAAPDAAQPKAA